MRSRQGTRPKISHRPESGTRIPEMTLTVVDLPAPLGPMYPTSSPASISKEIPSRALMVRCRRWASPRRAPQMPGLRSAMRKVLTRLSTMIWGKEALRLRIEQYAISLSSAFSYEETRRTRAASGISLQQLAQ